ncbi:hypothetical protein ACQEV4_40320 [Streptomyces shenzhenensis]|uniref:hypothetical protein n=1 Tax=Streptomyces shenzhenensis TaxID=943815 RepID=UPI003D8ADD45
MSRSKAKGTAAETAVVRYLQAAGFTQAERRTLAGVQDRGDIAGIPGVVIEVKNCARQELPAWVAEAEIERDNDNATLGVVWHKLRGRSSPGDWFVTMSGAQFAQLLREQQGLPAPTVELSEPERQFLTFALNLAFDRMVSDGGFTDEDEAALKKLRRVAAEDGAA